MDLKVILLPEKYHDYLVHVFQSYTRAGIPAEECAIAAETWNRLSNPQTVDYSQLGPAKVESLSPDGVVLSMDQGVGAAGV